MTRKILVTVLFCLSLACFGHAAPNAERHVVVMVWDGMRPDFVNRTNTPALFELAQCGTFFAHNHPAYVSSTEVNGTELATGAYPEHSGIIGNREYRSTLDSNSPIATESLDVMREADRQGGYLHVPTLAETLQKQGYQTAIAGTKPVVLLQDRAARPEGATNLVLFEGQTLPPGAVAGITNALGRFFDKGGSKTNRDLWTARALTENLWKDGVPAFSLLWMAEPDNTQHATGVGSAQSLAAIRNSDHALSLVVAALKAKGVYDTTDIFVVSDHGFSNISTNVNMVQHLRAAGFHAVRKFNAPPTTGDVLLVGLGGTALLYVTGHEEKTIDALVKFLQTEDSVSTILTAHPHEGTFALDDALIHSKDAPDVVIAFRWTSNTNAQGVPGTLVSESQGSNISPAAQKATHASLSPFDMHNTLVAAGPDVRPGFVDETPSGNVDVAPTIYKILGAKPPATLNGRVLTEALVASDAKPPVVQKKQLRAQAKLPTGDWEQTLT
ncbi:MAG TPA: alkaline phosphatase family protein, partial [Verrucomicrobiae bacterium]|nr:alkaline phosphatase family protein [Verrucomicrobiae bacterium]